MKTTFLDLNYNNYHTNRAEEMFLQLYDNWYSSVTKFEKPIKSSSNDYKPIINNHLSLIDLVTLPNHLTLPTRNELVTSTNQFINFTLNLNCSNSYFFSKVKHGLTHVYFTLDIINYIIIAIGILFNILNLIVLLKSKLNESPYTYLTMLALSDLGALTTELVRRILQYIQLIKFPKIPTYFILFTYLLINIFLSCSMYVTLALTIERFIFVNWPFKAMTICRKSIARRVCLIIFLFSVFRSLYLLFIYKPNCWDGFSQDKNKFVDLYEFIIGLAIPYAIIFIANISLIFSLKKQNNLMSIPLSTSNFSFHLNTATNLTNTTNLSNQDSLRINRNKLRRFSTFHARNSTIKKVSYRSSASLHLDHKNNKSKSVPNSNTMNSIATHVSDSSEQVKCLNNKNIQTVLQNDQNLKKREVNTSKMNSLCHRSSNIREMKNQKKLTTTLIIILCLLLICYLPSFIFEETLADFLFGAHDKQTNDSLASFRIKSIGMRISNMLIYFNCMANFLIYCFCNKKFKNSLKLLIKNSALNLVYKRLSYLLTRYCCRITLRKRTTINNNLILNTELEKKNNNQMNYSLLYSSYRAKLNKNNIYKGSLNEADLKRLMSSCDKTFNSNNNNNNITSAKNFRKTNSLIIK